MRVRVSLTVLLLTLAYGNAEAAVVTVFSSGTSFSPSVVTISEGDTIVWQNSSGSHTTTSGTGSADPNSGVLWHSALNGANPSFEREFPTAGNFPYYCQPHEFFGMTGTIIVEAAPICDCPNHGDPALNGLVTTNVIDVVLTVNVAFKGAPAVFDDDCPIEQTDIDCSGFTNVIDVVKMVNVAFKGGTIEANFCVPCP